MPRLPSKLTQQRSARVAAVLPILRATYPDARCSVDSGTPLQLLVATILSAQCTDERVNKVTPGLFKKYPTIRDFAAVNQDELAQDIKSTGFFNNKARSVIGAAKTILSDFKGQIPRTMDEMLTIPGAARKTSNVVLGVAYGIASGLVVDTHVTRISHRL